MNRRNTAKEKERVYAYGFDREGFPIGTRIETEAASIDWVSYVDERPLDGASGVILIQGMFERFRRVQGVFGESIKVDCDRDLMLERERQIRNLVAGGGWVCFLVGTIIDHVRQDLEVVSVEGTDLCKRALTGIDVVRESVQSGLSHVRSSTNEFIKYVQKFGVAKTVFGDVQRHNETRVLARASDAVVGFEASASVFFLPFHATSRGVATAQDVVSTVSDAVIAYRRKALVEVPSWAGSFRFHQEEELPAKIEHLRTEITETETRLDAWNRYKRVLALSGEFLRTEVIEIFCHYFGLEVDAADEGREDFKLVRDDAVLAMAEVKGTNGGVKREFINQADSHRERSGLTPEVPGLLIINNQIPINSVEERLKATVPADQVRHAKRLNVLIVRTVDLLFLMRHIEREPDKGAVVVSLLARGGGWLSADADGYRIEG